MNYCSYLAQINISHWLFIIIFQSKYSFALVKRMQCEVASCPRFENDCGSLVLYLQYILDRLPTYFLEINFRSVEIPTTDTHGISISYTVIHRMEIDFNLCLLSMYNESRSSSDCLLIVAKCIITQGY